MIIFMIVVSLCTPPPQSENALPSLKDIGKGAHHGVTKGAAVILAAVMIGLYIIFH